MSGKIGILLFCISVSTLVGFAQELEPVDFETFIIVYSKDQGYLWKPAEKILDITQNMTNLFFSSLADKSVLRLVEKEEKEVYMPLVAAEIKGSPREEEGALDVRAKATCSKLFYTIRLHLETSLPIKAVRLAYPQPYEQEDKKHPNAKLSEGKPQHRLQDGKVQISWQYVAVWENVLLDAKENVIPYYLFLENQPDPQAQEISLPPAVDAGVEISLSSKNFPFPLPTLENTEKANISGKMIDLQLAETPNRLFHLAGTWEWRNIRLKSALSEQSFRFPFWVKDALQLKEAKAQPLKALSSDHFLVFRCVLTPFSLLARQQSGSDILFKSSTILIDYNVESMPQMRVVLPSLTFTYKAYCWIMYPAASDKNEWVPILANLKDGRYHFSQVFPPKGSHYNLAIQTSKSKKVYINVPIGIPAKELQNYLQKYEEWAVPWERNF